MLAASVAAGAFGAHLLEQRLAADRLELWETAARYLAYAALAVLAMALARGDGGSRLRGAAAVAIGGAIFSGTVFALALGGPGWLGAVTPIGGAAMIGGLVLFGRDALYVERG